jgi:PAS domain S-box-containing protein
MNEIQRIDHAASAAIADSQSDGGSMTPQRLLEMRARALDSSSTHFMILEVLGNNWPIAYVNRTLAHAHGYEPGELIGLNPLHLIPPEENPVQLEAINKALRARQSVRSEVISRRKDGSTFWVGLSLEPVRDEQGRVSHYVSTGADITLRLAEAREKRRLQDQLLSEMQERERMAIDLRFAQKLEAVGRLAAGIAHEINTPIQYIGDSLTFLESGLGDLRRMLQDYRTALTSTEHEPVRAMRERLLETESQLDMPFLEAELPKAISRAADGVARVTDIVRAMKEFAHPDGSEQSPADLNRAIATTLTVARSEYKYLATVETHFGEIPPIVCNLGELNQVFLNLIVNAAHAIDGAGKDASSGRIVISTVCNGPWVEITFIDNGCGIPEQHVEKIFDPFFTTKEVGR